MDKKLICFDLDGTLLDSKKRIPVENYDSVKRLMDAGHIVTIATGRLFKSALKVSKRLPEGVKIIASNGAVVFDGNKVIRREHLPHHELIEIYELARDHDLNLTWNSLYAAYHTKLGPAFKYSYFMNVKNNGDMRIRNVHVRNIEEYKRYMSHFINAILICKTDPFRISDFRTKLEALGKFNIESSGHDNLEIIPMNSNKGTGALFLADRLGIKREDIISFGDQENDLKMIQISGIGVAMGNASEEVKAHSDIVTLTNDTLGIPFALKKIFKDLF